MGTGNQVLGDRRQSIEPHTLRVYSRRRESRLIKREYTPQNMGAGPLCAETDLSGWRDSIRIGQIFPG